MQMQKTVLWQDKSMPAKLFMINDGQITTYDLNRELKIVNSNNASDSQISINKDFVSLNHAIFDVDNGGCFFIDLSGTNTSLFNMHKVQANQKYYLKNGDIVKIRHNESNTQADVNFIFSTNYPNSFAWNSIENLENTAEINLGRSNDNGMNLSDENISVNHASFYNNNFGWNIVDFNSTNGVFVNGNRMLFQQTLMPCDCVRIANIHFIYLGDKFIFQNQTSPSAQTSNVPAQEIQDSPKQDVSSFVQASPAPQGLQNDDEIGVLSIKIVERSVWQKAKKMMLLQDININIKNGELVLILGGSGAGKTTFINAVMGYEKAEGEIKHEEIDIYKDFKEVKHKIGFVPQLDLLRGNDTVYDTLANAAEMKLSSKTTKEQMQERISVVLNTLGLSREIESLVSKLSGGQRKRLSIAVEYVADPSLFFLDEPDSGLDGIMAKTLMQNLRAIADEGKIVMVISHAPDRVAHLFDKVIVLAKSVQDNCGHLAFFGNIQDSLKFFDCENLEGIVERINRPDEGGDGLSDHYIDKYKSYIGG